VYKLISGGNILFMQLFKHKKAMIGGMKTIVFSIIGAILGMVVVFYLVGNLAPTLTTAAGNISGSGLPLANLFGSNGLLLLLFMVMLLLALIVTAMKMVGNKK